MTNTELYNKLRAVPQEAQKTIGAGRLKGFTDINPMWRIKMLTETFGPAGIGWYIDNVQCDTDKCDATGEVATLVSLNLYVKVDGEWSKPIFGIGGSTLVARENNGPHLNDEAYKMAYTDAISVACKALGMAADIYFNKDIKAKDNLTKYDQTGDAPAPQDKPMGLKERWIKSLALGERNAAGVTAEEAYKAKFNPSPEDWALLMDEVYHYRKEHNIANPAI